MELSPVLPSLCYLNFSRYHSCFTGCREEPPSFPFFRQSNHIILSPPSAIITRYGVTCSLYNLRVTGCMSRRTRHIHKVLIIRMCALFQYYIVLDYSFSAPPAPKVSRFGVIPWIGQQHRQPHEEHTSRMTELVEPPKINSSTS